MFKSYFVTAIRNIKRHKAFSIINIMGLAIGMAVCLLIAMYIKSELSYDRFHKDYDKIFRVQVKSGDPMMIKLGYSELILTPAILKDVLLEKYSNVKSVCRIRYYDPQGAPYKYNGNMAIEKSYLEVDPSFFNIFGYEFTAGNKTSAMPDQNSMVVTKSFASRCFGDSNPVGQIISIWGKDYKVTAVVKDVPANSHLKFNFLLPLEIHDYESKGWTSSNFTTYIKTDKPDNFYSLGDAIKELPKYYTSNSAKNNILYLLPLKDIHYKSNTKYEYEAAGNINYVYGLSALGIIVLILACVNFMNLSTAQASERSMEIGLRKTVGADKKEIIKQFLAESMSLSFIAVCFSILIVIAILPFFNRLTGTEIKISGNLSFLLMVLVLGLVTGLLAGSYPAFVLSSFRPINIIRKRFDSTGKYGAATLRRTMIVFQFIVCSFLIAGAIGVDKQIHFIFNKDMGYKKDQIIVMPIRDYKTIKAVKSEMLNSSFVQSASLSSYPPDQIGTTQNFFWDTPQNDQMFTSNAVDPDYFKTFDIKLSQGRFFNEQSEDSPEEQYILNETAVKYMKAENPIGMKMGRGDKVNGQVVGVVKDFHFKSLREKIEPLVLSVRSNGYSYLSLKINTADISGAINEIKDKYRTIVPNKPFDYYFLDEHFAKIYSKETQLAEVIKTFSLLAIIVACLGMLGLVTYSIGKKKKEIGVRKILGAEINNIIFLISKEFLILIILANVIAMPFSYYLIDAWLKDFVYKTEISWWIFPAAMLVSLFISAVTIGFQTIKAATANPVDSIRYE
jgi:putative ABC transport system permease protein